MVCENRDCDSYEQLEHQVASLEQKNERLTQGLMAARKTITDLSDQLEAVMKPPRTYATFLALNHDSISDVTVKAMVNGRMMELAVSDSVDCTRMEPGQQLLLNEQLVIVGSAGYMRTGEIVAVKMLMDHGRALVTLNGAEEHVVYLSGRLIAENVRPGDMLLADLRSGCAIESVERPDVERLMLEETPNIRYSDVGGLEKQIEKIRDAVELPFEHPHLYREHGLKPPKGVLLYGPPGCGKTMIAKAVATELAYRASSADSGDVYDMRGNNPDCSDNDQNCRSRSFFLNVKGPQLLDKYVGETERQIREIFSRARELAVHGLPVVVFFDEMEALFRARGSGISSDTETTIVPQLLAEIDGVEQLDNVIVIGASNREDMIDPAILRPGRLDVKIKIDRPTREDAYSIILKYLTPHLPISEDAIHDYGTKEQAVHALARATINEVFRRDNEHECAVLTYADGAQETLYTADFVSGAMLAAIVDRAKRIAIKTLLATGVKGISLEHLLQAVHEEERENEDVASIENPEEWARVNGRVRGKKIISITPAHNDGN